jgi:hypothetical protein
LWENWVHHEDIRRANDLKKRPDNPQTDAVLWKALWTISRYQRSLLDGLRLELREPAGRRLGVGRGEPVIVSGPIGELAMFLAGRYPMTTIDFDGEPSAVSRAQGVGLGL